MFSYLIFISILYRAVRGVTHVIHVASPFPDRIPSNPDELIKPAVEGTLAVLKAASEAGGVKRVVLTSSIASVYGMSLFVYFSCLVAVFAVVNVITLVLELKSDCERRINIPMLL